MAAPEPEAAELPDPAIAGDAALLDALHEALASDGADLSAELAAEEPLAREPDPPPPSTLLAPTAASTPAVSAEDFAFGDSGDGMFEEEKPSAAPTRRPLRVSAAIPERLGSEAIVVEIEGRGRAKLAYAKIDAVAAAGVKGISQSGKAVLLIDLVIGWAAGEGALRIVRLRADAFDPRTLIAGQSSPLAALRALVSELRARTRGAALPSESEPNAPFRIFADLASYEREALGAEPS